MAPNCREVPPLPLVGLGLSCPSTCCCCEPGLPMEVHSRCAAASPRASHPSARPCLWRPRDRVVPGCLLFRRCRMRATASGCNAHPPRWVGGSAAQWFWHGDWGRLGLDEKRKRWGDGRPIAGQGAPAPGRTNESDGSNWPGGSDKGCFGLLWVTSRGRRVFNCGSHFARAALATASSSLYSVSVCLVSSVNVAPDPIHRELNRPRQEHPPKHQPPPP